MNNKFRGICSVVGDYGAGKTVFALGNGADPSKIMLINDDVKTPPDVDYFKLFDLQLSLENMDTRQSYEWIMAMLDELEEDSYKFDNRPDVIVWDTWTGFSKLCRKMVDEYPGQFAKKWSPKSDIRNGEVSREGRKIETKTLSRLKNLAKIVIVTFYPKPLYINGVLVPGKKDSEATQAVRKGADLRLWLTPNPDLDAPVGLVLKNIAKHTVTADNGLSFVKILPQRINGCDWRTIMEYYDDPIGTRMSLRPDEIPNDFEISIIDGTLTPEQKRQWESSLTASLDMFEDNTKDDTNIIRTIIEDNNIAGPPPVKLKLVNEHLSKNGQPEITIDQLREAM